MRIATWALVLTFSMGGARLVAVAGPSLQSANPVQGHKLVTRIVAQHVVQAAKLIRQVPPVYPPIAKEAHIQGTVRLNVVIGPDGTVRNVKVISGIPLLMPAAIQAVRQWRYQPALLNGRPIEVAAEVEVSFKLAGDAPPPMPGPTPAQQAAQLEAEREAIAAVDPTESADIRQLFDAIGLKEDLMQAAMAEVPQIANLAFARLPLAKKKEATELLTQLVVQRFRTDAGIYDVLVPIYARHFSDQEIRIILAFYRSPVGQKLVREQIPIMREMHGPFMAHWNLIVMPALMEEFSRMASPIQDFHPAQPPNSAK